MNFKKKLIFSVFFVLIAFTSYSQSLVISDLTSEYKNNPIGIDITNPRLAWKITSNVANCLPDKGRDESRRFFE